MREKPPRRSALEPGSSMPEGDRLAVVDAVVTELVEGAGVVSEKLMVIGAEARDHLHHDVFASDLPVRGTQDVDVALAIDSWTDYERVTSGYSPTGANGVRYLVAEIPVDFMPFGEAVEEPDGVVVPASRREEMSVFGFQDVFADAAELVLPSGYRVRVPSAPGYVALKLRAWVDRSSYDDKDARDLALAVEWYCSSPEMVNELWDEVEDAVFLEYESDTDLVGADALVRGFVETAVGG
ncbi:hypothetical protein [Curtobacterium sp. MCBA15_012]|uniref:hypothetical protein n=1 Tax=Curtobacterium sp. MCBA15_012 TaxID=1898738 RepID=UPI0027340A49|nr:hypothetical protein [Curtobacterium sp. MCBA15_012]WIB01805.1 hypothetical protein QOL15_12860 [Curtobacterium sp. MCBA15_012]